MFYGPEQAGVVVGNASGLFGLFNILLSLATIIWTWHTRSQSAAADRVAKIELRLTPVEEKLVIVSADRIVKIEGRMDLAEDKLLTVDERLKHLPTKEDIQSIALQLERVLGSVNRQDAQFTAMSRTVNRIDDYMREKA